MSIHKAIISVTAALTFVCASCYAEELYPNRPIRIVVPQPAASGGDVLARMLAEKLSTELPEAVVVENRPGANGILAANFVKSDTSGGHTLLLTGVSVLSFNGSLYKNLSYRPFDDFSYIASIADTSYVLISSKKSGITNLRDLKDKSLMKENSLTYASAGIGNSSHLAAEMIFKRMGIKALHVPYKGSAQILNALLAGEVDLTVGIPSSSAPLIKDGSVTGLAVMSGSRLSDIPSVPTFKELNVTVPSMPGWYALVGPADMPSSVIDKLSQLVQKFVEDPQIKAKLAAMSMSPLLGSPEEIRIRALHDAKVWGDFIDEQNIKLN